MKIKYELDKLIYKSGFISFGIKDKGGWEKTKPLNPEMADEIIKVIPLIKLEFNLEK